MRFITALLGSLFAALSLTSIAVAQSAKTGKLLEVPAAKTYIVPAGKLYRVDEGVFDLQIGKSIDLTDRKVLLAATFYRERKCCELTVNGRRVNWRGVGARIDLKRYAKDAVSDKDVCVLDVVDIAVPKGAPGVMTFRLHCP